MFSAGSQILSGKELTKLFSDSSFRSLLFSEKVVMDASKALVRISEYYGLSPSTNGDNIVGIREVRDLLFKNAKDKSYINGLTITAPHTHWVDEKPVIYSYSQQAQSYLIGPQSPEMNSEYIPVSFIFSEKYPLAYEWADETINIEKSELKECLELIYTLNNALQNKSIPLGIAIDFRFKDSLRNIGKSSLEMPVTNIVGFEKFSYITNEFSSPKYTNDEAIEQVSWHAVSDLFFDFSEVEKNILHHIREQLEKYNTDQEKLETIESLFNNAFSSEE